MDNAGSEETTGLGMALVPHDSTRTASVSRETIAAADFQVLKNWVRNELFDKGKFLYNQANELRVNGVLYRLFAADCRDRLVGLKTGQRNDEYAKLYMAMLWTEANQKKRNMVANGLTTRRSTVFSSMQNQFVGM
jgi:hypothetical protein